MSLRNMIMGKREKNVLENIKHNFFMGFFKDLSWVLMKLFFFFFGKKSSHAHQEILEGNATRR